MPTQNQSRHMSKSNIILALVAIAAALVASCVPAGYGISYTNETDGVQRTITVERFSK